jgi:predicted ATP-grasp superfamily ATP-dependent carboligase
MTKIGFVSPKGLPTLCIYYDDKAKKNPYRVYQEWKEIGPYGLRSRRKLVEQYADLFSCAYVILNYCRKNNEEKR